MSGLEENGVVFESQSLRYTDVVVEKIEKSANTPRRHFRPKKIILTFSSFFSLSFRAILRTLLLLSASSNEHCYPHCTVDAAL